MSSFVLIFLCANLIPRLLHILENIGRPVALFPVPFPLFNVGNGTGDEAMCMRGEYREPVALFPVPFPLFSIGNGTGDEAMCMRA